jgi:D-beta-D-heptose 7-phosphate kinase/D-beta-D-heptose 1-phosphate adenosyltransferase
MDIVSRFKSVRVLVVGDIMLDRYWWGGVTRISPEAPVPVVALKETTSAAGGAANVAANVSALGAIPILLGCIGNDTESEELVAALDKANILHDKVVRVGSKKTTVKTRVIAHGQQIVRVDQENIEPLSEFDQQQMRSAFLNAIADVDAIAISDYAKGLLTAEFLNEMIVSSKDYGLPTIVDPKGRDYTRYRGATLLTPNRHEAALACNLDDIGKPVVNIAGDKLLSELGLDAVLITEGEDGMTLFQKEQEPVHLPASAREVYDSTGAGDTVIAALAVSLAASFGLSDAAKISNAAAGLVVEKVGTATVTSEAVAAALNDVSYQAVQ